MSLRSFAREQALNVLGAFAHPAPGIHILNGHRVQDGVRDRLRFRKMLQQLSRQVEFIRIEDAVERIARHEQPDHAQVAFTFDDGFTDCYHYFCPVLEEFGTNAMLFVNPHYVEGNEAYIHNFNNNVVLTPGKHPMRWEQLRELSDRGHIIAAHTLDHFMITSNDANVLRHQIVDCRKPIEDHIGKPCDYFAFPYGKLSQANQQAIDIACEAYKYVFSQSDHRNYFSFGGKVINRRHFEPFWPVSHVRYFLSCHKQ